MRTQQHGRQRVVSRWKGRFGALVGAISILLVVFAGSACGQPAGGSPAGPEDTGAEELKLDPVTVTATRTPRRISTVGDSVEVISKEWSDLLLPGDFSEVLREAVGAVLDQTGSRGGTTNFRIRGSEANFTSVLIDGFKVSPPDGEAFNFEHLSPEWVGRAEILRGPQSALYGSDAAGGVVNLLLDVGRPGESPSFETGVRHGSFSTWEEVAKVRGGTERAGYLASLSRIDTDGRFENDGYYRTVATAAFDYFLHERAKARLLYQANENRLDITSNAGATNTDLRLAAPFTDRELNAFQKNLDQLAGLRLELQPTPWLEYIPRASYYRREILVEDTADALDLMRPFFSPFRNETTQTRYLVDNQVNLRFAGKDAGLEALTRSITTLGFEWEEERFLQETRGTSGGTVNRERRARSLYAQQQLTLWRDLTFTAGVRADDFDVGEDETTGKLSAAYRFRKTGTKFRGAVGVGRKRPSFLDQFTFLEFGPITVRGNPNLKSERQENWEAGLDQTFLGRKLRLSATYFQSELKDLIAFSFGGFPNRTNFENISRVRLKGAEFSLALVDFHDITARLNYNTLDTEVLDDRGGLGGSSFVQGEELLRRPNWWWSASIAYHPDRFRASLRLLQVSSRRDQDFRPFVDGSNGGAARTVNNSGYTKVDLALGYDLVENHKVAIWGGFLPGLKKLSVELKVLNLLDEDYDEVFGFNAPGIQWFAGLRVLF